MMNISKYFRKMVTDRIRTHLKDLLAENEGDAVEKLR